MLDRTVIAAMAKRRRRTCYNLHISTLDEPAGSYKKHYATHTHLYFAAPHALMKLPVSGCWVELRQYVVLRDVPAIHIAMLIDGTEFEENGLDVAPPSDGTVYRPSAEWAALMDATKGDMRASMRNGHLLPAIEAVVRLHQKMGGNV